MTQKQKAITKLVALSREERLKLRVFVSCTGRTWKSVLCNDWSQGADTLRETRNTLGPSLLRALSAKDVIRHTV